MSVVDFEYGKKLVSDFLAPLGLDHKYTNYFAKSGITEAEDIMSVTEDDLMSIGVREDDHIRAILQAASTFNGEVLKEAELRCWLREGDLVEHINDFLQKGVRSLQAAAGLELTEETLDELGVYLHGQRRRLHRRLHELKRTIGRRNEPLPTVHKGYWSTPETMKEAHSKFLCTVAVAKAPAAVEAGYAAATAAKTEPLPFLVDTGSECSALTRDIIDKLKLPKKGQTTVIGVNSRSTTDVFGAVLEIGGQDISVNIVEAETNAVGIATVSKFKHFISSKDHHWLPL